MRRVLLASTVAAAALLGCMLFPDEELHWMRSATGALAVAIPDSVRFGEPVWFEIVCGVGDPCWEFSHLDMVRENTDVHVKVHAKRDPRRACVCVTSTIRVEAFFVPPARGDYLFHFCQTDTSTIDRTVAVW
jgi:hypothetical protein